MGSAGREKDPGSGRDKGRLKLALAYVECLRELPEEKISVKAVTDRCGMVRQHFYHYFEDINGLVYWFNAYHITSILGRYEKYEWEVCTPEILQMMTEHREFYCTPVRSGGNARLEQVMYRDVYCLYRDLLQYHLGDEMPEVYVDLLKIYCHGAVGLLCEWLHGGMERPVPEITSAFRDALPPKLAEALMRPVPISYLRGLGRDMARLGSSDEPYF